MSETNIFLSTDILGRPLITMKSMTDLTKSKSDGGVGIGLQSNCATFPQASSNQIKRGAPTVILTHGLVSKGLDFFGANNESAPNQDGFQYFREEEVKRLGCQFLNVENFVGPPLQVKELEIVAKAWGLVHRVRARRVGVSQPSLPAPSPIATPSPTANLFQSQTASVVPPSPLAHVSSPSSRSPVLSPPRTSLPPQAPSPNPTLSPPPALSHPLVSSPELPSTLPHLPELLPSSLAVVETPASSSSTPVVAPRQVPTTRPVQNRKPNP
nr:hypothetical protein Iba_chr12dCG11480 [Ipomoea batatas]